MEYIIPTINNIINMVASDNGIDLITECPRLKKCCEDFRGYYWPSMRKSDYREPNCGDPYYQIAYLYKYASLRADIITHIFEKERSLYRLLTDDLGDSGLSSVCVLGTGPGTELIGLAKWIELENIAGQIDFVLTDYVEEWINCLYHTQKQISVRSPKKPINILKFYCNDESYGNILDDDNLLDTKLYIISYVISEIMQNHGKLIAFRDLINGLFRRSSSGTKIIFVDRNENSVDETIRTIVEDDLVSLSEKRYPSSARSPSESMTKNFRIRNDERLNSFGNLHDNLKTRFNESPELMGNVFWVIGTRD